MFLWRVVSISFFKTRLIRALLSQLDNEENLRHVTTKSSWYLRFDLDKITNLIQRGFLNSFKYSHSGWLVYTVYI